MTGFDLPSNFDPNPERIGRVVRRRVVPPQKKLSDSRSFSAPPPYPMAPVVPPKTLRQFSAPSSSSFPGLEDNGNQGENGFEPKTGLINMIQASQFNGKASEDANVHLQTFLEVSSTINPKGSTMDAIHLRLFPFLLLGKAKLWFYTSKATFNNNWQTCANAFLTKYFPVSKTNALRGKISGFQQQEDETVSEAWEHLQEYLAACPHHGLEEWLITQSFFHGLNQRSQEHFDAAAGGSFLSLDVAGAKALIEKIASKVGRERGSQPAPKESIISTPSTCRSPRWIFL